MKFMPELHRSPSARPGQFDRRTFLSASIGLAGAAELWTTGLAGSRLWGAQGSASAYSPIVETTLGRVRGRTGRGVHSFKGVFYGATTGGRNRFMPPRRRAPWAGVVDAMEYGASAPQRGELVPGRPTSYKPVVGNEDCLVLNVWTRGLGDAKRPVMVWLHSGGFSSGSGSTGWCDGTNLCRRGDVVVVTLNHRLNAFGSTYLAEIGGEELGDSGCVGMLDLVMALEWVRDNIDRFGGDPGNVMVFGESGGGRKTSTLLCMPTARGLFHRAAIQSGAVLRVTEPEDATAIASSVMTKLGLRPGQTSELQQVPVDRFLAASIETAGEHRPRRPIVGTALFTPVRDGRSIPTHPFDPEAPEMSADIPVMVGWNRTEETLYARGPLREGDLDSAGLQSRVENRLGDSTVARRVVEAYSRSHPAASPWDLYILIATDHPRGMYPRELAKRKAALGRAPAYLYRFDWELDEVMRAPHYLEVQFVFDNLHRAETRYYEMQPTAEAVALAARVSSAWISFARTGDPGTADLPPWPAYSEATRDTMIFNNESRTESDPESDLRLVMEEVLGLASRRLGLRERRVDPATVCSRVRANRAEPSAGKCHQHQPSWVHALTTAAALGSSPPA
jgi:para-nitrobenzyl esterase